MLKRKEIRSMLSLAAPITIMQLGMMSYGVVDTMFMGRSGNGRGDSSTPGRVLLPGLETGPLPRYLMCCSAVVFLAMPEYLLGLYTPENTVVALGIPLLGIAALFQIFDGVQVVLTGALRGLGETRIPFYANVLGHAVIGIPLGYWLAFHGGLGPRGLWIGLLTGLGAVAVLLFGV